tara:strand:+ start:423 stop:851 length:429 start_codon:yes stop_codon:yes gene_type:complete
MTIAIGSDHAGFTLKKHIKEFFSSEINFIDVGTNSEDSVDYPDFAHIAVKELYNNNCEKIILICGSGNGIQMTANKYQKIRCALCWNEEIASLARLHNDANALAIPARYISINETKKIVSTFINTSFAGGRHERRKEKISCD